jgi:predicted nuclease of predicted toxin-antitoxin system
VKFLVDECTDSQLVDLLRAEGYDVFYVMEAMRGATDDDILRKAYTEQRILLTEDKDFGELVFRLRKPAVGVILLRFNPSEEAQKATRLRQLLQNSTIALTGAFVVVEIGKIRIRPLIS